MARLSNNSLSYMGVASATPPNFFMIGRAPTNSDYKKFKFGDIWHQKDTQNIWMFTDLNAGVATWTDISIPGSALFTDITVTPGDITITDGGLIIEAIAWTSTLRTLADGTVYGLPDGDDGELLIGATGLTPSWQNITSSGGTVTITNSSNGINLEAAGGTAANTYTTDDANVVAPDGAGNVNVVGGTNIGTTGAAANTITVHLDNGTQGQILIGSDSGDSAWANLTSTNGTVTITEGDNTLNLEANGLQINEQTNTSYTLQLLDSGKEVKCSNVAAIALTIPTNAAVSFVTGTMIAIVQGDSGTITVTPDAGVTLRSAGGMYDLYEMYSGAVLIKHDTNLWYLFGDLKV